MNKEIASVLEAIMIAAFGFSWPNNIITSLKNKSTKGKSLLFLLLIDFGYVCGIAGKIVNWNPSKWWVFAIYILNFVMVSIDLCLYFYYRSREKKNGRGI